MCGVMMAKKSLVALVGRCSVGVLVASKLC